jgi:proteasome lid subunit RPN8/RPN11
VEAGEEAGHEFVVRIRQAAFDAVLAHARAEAPLECCGLVVGSSGLIERAVPARNALASRTRFLVDPEDHFAAIRTARAEGLEVIGAYHSHPASAAAPSPRDLAEAGDPDLLCLIAGLPRGELRAYRLVDGNFHPVVLVPCS